MSFADPGLKASIANLEDKVSS